VANGFVSEYLKNKKFVDKIGFFQFNSHFYVEKTLKRPRILGVHLEMCGFIK